MALLWFFFFFFQAEDGIRDTSVTGVQTCGSSDLSRLARRADQEPPAGAPACPCVTHTRPVAQGPRAAQVTGRSEERRVGKECRSGWSPDHEKKKRNRTRQKS